jgi:predicted RNA binding protein YcfA (HicA-like mRNA interferase family)
VSVSFTMKYRDIVKVIERDGWILTRTRWSHRHYAHPNKPGVVTIAGHLSGSDVPPSILNSILKQAGLK